MKSLIWGWLFPRYALLIVTLATISISDLFCQPFQQIKDSLVHKIESLPDSKEKIEALYKLSELSVRKSNPSNIALAFQGLNLAKKINSPSAISTGYQLIATYLVEYNRVDKSLDSAVLFAEMAYKIAEKNNLKSEMIRALLPMAKCYTNQGDPIKGITKTNEVVAMAEEIQDRIALAKGYAQLVLLHLRFGNDSLALICCQKANYYVDSLGQPLLAAKIDNHFGSVYENLHDYPKALHYYEKYFRKSIYLNETYGQGIALLNIAGILRLQGKKKLWYLANHRNLLFARQHNEFSIEGSALQALGIYFEEEKKYDSALYYGNKVLELWEKGNFMEEIARGKGVIGYRKYKLGNTQDGIKDIKEALIILKKLMVYDEVKKYLIGLTEIYEKEGLYKDALYYQRQLTQINDSINSREHLRRITRFEYQVQLDNAKRINELLTLKSINSQAKIDRQNLENTILIAGIFLTLGFILFFIHLLQVRQKSNKILKEKNFEIEQQSEELKVVLENLQLAQKQMIQSDKMASLGQLTAGIAHELNNPLNYINGGVIALNHIQLELIQLLRDKDSITESKIQEAEQDMNSLMKSIETGVNRSTNIIKSLRTFSNPLDEVAEISRTNLLNCIDSSLTLLNSKITDKRIKIEKDCNVSHIAKANESMISQVLVNLLDNAIQALESKEGERLIQIRTEVAGNDIEIRIKDNGTGIAPEHQPHIMNPFFTTKDVGKGTGLGLSISYGIIQKHKGKLTFTSESGRGTEFVITLPGA